MEFTQIEIEELKQKLRQGQKLDDLADLVNHVINLQNLKSGTQYKPISGKKLKYYYANINKKYINFEIPKKTGGTRPIAAPDKFLKKVQRRINLVLSLIFQPKQAAHGFVENRSIVTNAKIHVQKKHVLNIDLKEFFPSIHYGRLKAVLQLKPFESNPEFAHLISNICCLKGILPQGAPTSPIFTNIVCQRLDSKLVKLAQDYHCFFTRYADDITFSSDKNKFKEEFLSKLDALIKSEGFSINEKKTRIQKKVNRQEVTGIIVNQKLNLSRDYIKNVRAILNNWEKYGYEKASAKFGQYYPQEKGFVRNKSIPRMENVIMGKILFLGMVRGKNDPIYLKYHHQLHKLTTQMNQHE
jgi:RNA-directed DNA polymerase